MSLRALVFDVDGTIADTEEAHRRAFNEAFRAHGLPWNWDRRLYAELLQVTGGKERIASYLSRPGVIGPNGSNRAAGIAAIHATKTALYRRLLESDGLRSRPGVRQLIDEARAAGTRLAIASTTSIENIEPLVTAAFGREALRWFSAIATGDMVAAKKPAPDVYNAALAMLQLEPDSAVAIEDSAIGVQAAKAAGLYTVATPTDWSHSQDFAAADLVLSSLADLREPSAVSQAGLIGGLDRLRRMHAEATGRGHACPD